MGAEKEVSQVERVLLKGSEVRYSPNESHPLVHFNDIRI